MEIGSESECYKANEATFDDDFKLHSVCVKIDHYVILCISPHKNRVTHREHRINKK